MTKVNRLSEVINPDDFKSEYLKIEEVVGQSLAIGSFVMERGSYGNYALIEVFQVELNKAGILQTGAKPILAALQAIESVGGFPVLATIVNYGRTYQLTDGYLPPGTKLQDLSKLFTAPPTNTDK